MTSFSAAEIEAQRVAHLVLGQPRPAAPAPTRPAGMSKQAWKVRRKALLAMPSRLAPEIEAQVALREEWGGGKGTPETRRHAAVEAAREGSLARLVRSGTIDAHQLAAAEEIREAHAVIVADVAVRTARLERGVQGGVRGTGEEEGLGRIMRQRAYGRWREAVAPNAAMLLAIIIDDLALTAAARRWRMSDRRARRVLIAALDAWRRG